MGSGKTAVAFLALLAAAGSGHQGALMAPTEVLATQHGKNLAALLASLPAQLPGGRRRPTCALITGGVISHSHVAACARGASRPVACTANVPSSQSSWLDPVS